MNAAQRSFVEDDLRQIASLLLVAGAICIAAGQARAETWDWRDVGFGLRLPLALDRASVFTDVVGLSASTAYPYGSAINPANDDFLRLPPNQFTLAGTGSGVFVAFEGGASITGTGWSANYRFPMAGTVTASYAQSASRDAHTHQGENLRLHSEEFSLGYSHRATANLAVGGEFRFTDSRLRLESTAEGFPLIGHSDSEGYDGRLGILFAASDEWLIGMTVGAGWVYTDNNGQIDVPVAFGGPINIATFSDFTRSVQVRTGAGWRPSDAFGLYMDAQWLRLKNDDEAVSVGRAFVGVEYLPIQLIALRVGGSVDTAGKTTVSTGVGIYLKHVQFEVAYSYNAFPEVRREFGPANLFSVSVVGTF